MDGLIFVGGYVRRDVCVSKSIGLAYSLLYFTLYLRAIFQAQDPGGLLLEGAISRRVFCVTRLGELIHGGAYFGILR